MAAAVALSFSQSANGAVLSHRILQRLHPALDALAVPRIHLRARIGKIIERGNPLAGLLGLLNGAAHLPQAARKLFGDLLEPGRSLGDALQSLAIFLHVSRGLADVFDVFLGFIGPCFHIVEKLR